MHPCNISERSHCKMYAAALESSNVVTRHSLGGRSSANYGRIIILALACEEKGKKERTEGKKKNKKKKITGIRNFFDLNIRLAYNDLINI